MTPERPFVADTPTVSYEAFARTFDLDDWKGIDEVVGDDVASPLLAAKQAAHRAACASRTGTVLVYCEDQPAEAKLFMAHLTFMFEDKDEFRSQFKSASSDTLELRSGTKIVVSTRPRRPADLLSCIKIPLRERERASPRDVARAIFIAVDEGPRVTAQIEDSLGLIRGEFFRMSALAEDRRREEWDQYIRARQGVFVKQQPAPTAVPVIPRFPTSPDRGPVVHRQRPREQAR
jgi:hypothetical protein